MSSWRDSATCKGVAHELGPIFWSEDPEDQALALTYCDKCPVKKECGESRQFVFADLPMTYGGTLE